MLVCLVCILATSCVEMKFDISFIVDNENYGRITTDGNEQIAMPETSTNLRNGSENTTKKLDLSSKANIKTE